jgi:hypothetical protein
VVGVGERRPGTHLAGLRVQQPAEGDHALPGGRQPQPPLLLAAFGVVLGAVGVGDPPQMGNRPPQPG